MKRLLAVILTVLCILPAFAFQSVGAAPNAWNDFWLTHYNTSTNEAAGTLVTKNEGNVINAWAWRIVLVFEPVDKKPGVYELTQKHDLLSCGAESEEVINAFTGSSIPDGGFIYHINAGNDYSSTGGINYKNDHTAKAIADASSWEIGTKFEFINLNLESFVAPTLTPNLNWYDNSYVCTAKYRIYKEESRSATETVAIDGVHNDNAWLDYNWTSVNGDNGYWQKNFSDKSLSFKYQFRTDATNLYGAAVIYNPPVAGSGNGSATNFRIWFNTSATATGATSYYDIFYSTNGNAGITPSVSGSKMAAVLTATDNAVMYEFSVPLSEIGAANLEQIPYFISVSTNNGSEEPCLYYPKVYWSSSSVFSPKTNWYRANDGDLNAYALRLNGLEYTLSSDGSYYILTSAGTSASGAVVIPSTYAGLPVKEIGRLAFTESAISSVVIPDSVVSIAHGAFSQCKSLTSVTLGNGVTEIGMMAFLGCEALKEISIPSSVTTIGNAAFSSTGLTEFRIPETVSKVGSNAFAFCDSLTDIYCDAASKPADWSEVWSDNCKANIHFEGVSHNFESNWSKNESFHWHACTHCSTVVADKAPHTPDESGKFCTYCKYELDATNGKLGDVNDDGAIDQFDYILVKRHYFETRYLTDDEFARADVNGDGAANQFDYILIKRHYFGTYVLG